MTEKKRPNSMHNLDNAIRRVSGHGQAYVNVRSIIANAIVASMMPDGVVKGGSSLKMRFGDAATRFTTDLDTARASDLKAFLDALSESLIEGWCGFTGRVVPVEPPHPDGVPAAYVMQPFDIKLSYLGRSWCTVKMEVGHDEIGDADEPEYVLPIEANAFLEQMGFPALGPIPCMPLHHQIAQKLHAVSAEGSERVHDLIDLQLIASRGDIDWLKTRRTCERLFAYRCDHAWPPEIVVGERWPELYAEQIGGLDVVPEVLGAVAWTNDLINRIAEA